MNCHFFLGIYSQAKANELPQRHIARPRSLSRILAPPVVVLCAQGCCGRTMQSDSEQNGRGHEYVSYKNISAMGFQHEDPSSPEHTHKKKKRKHTRGSGQRESSEDDEATPLMRIEHPPTKYQATDVGDDDIESSTEGDEEKTPLEPATHHSFLPHEELTPRYISLA